jgi:Na+/proline symporter
MHLMSGLDLVVVGAFLALSLTFGVLWAGGAGRSTDDFFLSGRQLRWWLAGVSMAATNFSIDSPLGTTKFVAQGGVAGMWIAWAGAIGLLLVAVFFSRLWRRAELVTDAELIELRYGGRSAAALRLLKGLYFGVFLNCWVLGWAIKAVIKITAGVTTLPVEWVLVVTLAVALIYTLAAGLTGVVWSDLVQYAVSVSGSMLLAFFALREVGGPAGLARGLADRLGSAEAALTFVPGAATRLFAATGFELEPMPLSAFLVYVLVQWWANKYSDGGGKHIQRMMACRSEGQAQGAVLFFVGIGYIGQQWPWIVTALCALVLLGPLPDPEMGYPMLMQQLLPPGMLGLLVATMLGAFMSTVDTHLNLGAAYLVNDVYRRFLRPEATPRHYVQASRLAMIGLLGLALAIGLAIESIGEAYRFLLAFAGGAGLVWIVRWFWWRINAWSEIAAMLTSGATTIALHVGYPEMGFTAVLLRVALASSAVALAVTLLTPPVDDQTLRRFWQQVRPGRVGWGRLGIGGEVDQGLRMGRALGNWAGGLVSFFALNVGVGKLLFGSATIGLALLGLALLSGIWLYWRLAAGASATESAG